MIKKSFILLLFVLLILPAFGISIEELKELEGKGTINADLYYNIGVLYQAENELASATLYYLKALNLNSAHAAAKENLSFVQMLSLDRERYPQHLFLPRIFIGLYGFMNLNRMALYLLISFIFAALAFLWLALYDKEKEKGLPVLVFSLLLFFFLLGVFFSVIKYHRYQNNSRAVLFAESAELYQSPSHTSSRVDKIHKAIVLDVIKSEGNWHLVRIPDGSKGWLYEPELKRVKEAKAG